MRTLRSLHAPSSSTARCVVAAAKVPSDHCSSAVVTGATPRRDILLGGACAACAATAIFTAPPAQAQPDILRSELSLWGQEWQLYQRKLKESIESALPSDEDSAPLAAAPARPPINAALAAALLDLPLQLLASCAPTGQCEPGPHQLLLCVTCKQQADTDARTLPVAQMRAFPGGAARATQTTLRHCKGGSCLTGAERSCAAPVRWGQLLGCQTSAGGSSKATASGRPSPGSCLRVPGAPRSAASQAGLGHSLATYLPAVLHSGAAPSRQDLTSCIPRC
jgi:hypothetical protein